MVFNPDGTAWATAHTDGSVHLWDVATARPIGAARTLRVGVSGTAFSPDGRSLLAVDSHGNVSPWPVPQHDGRSAEAVVRDVQVRTAMEIDSAGAIAFLSPSRWNQLRADSGDAWWNAFAALAGERARRVAGPQRAACSRDASGVGLGLGATDDRAWHEANARDAEALGDAFGARWHLDRLIAAQPDDGLLYARRARAALWAGAVRTARADIERAIRLGPRDRILDWLEHRTLDFLSDHRPADALRLLEPVVAARPDDWLAYALAPRCSRRWAVRPSARSTWRGRSSVVLRFRF